MKVEIISATEKPIDVISLAAGCCYGKNDASEKRVANCYKAGHLSVFEHATITLKIEGISRACMAQLTRHRHCSFCVESQRYNRYDLEGDDWYVMPEVFDTDYETSGFDHRKTFKGMMHGAAMDYNLALSSGIKPEDARYMLPEATKTNLVMTCNIRELFHILDMRLSKAAQWEIYDLMEGIYYELRDYNEQWSRILDLWDFND